MLNVPVDWSESQRTLGDGENKGYYHKTPAFRMDFDLTVCPLERPWEQKIIQINKGGLRFNNEPCKQYKIT